MILQQGEPRQGSAMTWQAWLGDAMTPEPSLSTVLSRIGETQAHLPPSTSVLIGLAALAAAILRMIWLFVRHANTIAHEGAHAVTGSAIGRKVQYVWVNGNGTGETRVSQGGTAGNAVFFFVGYVGPSAFGLGAAKLIEIGHIVAVLWLTLVLLAFLLLVLGKVFSYVPVLAAGALIYLIARYASVGANVVTAYAIAWFLLVSGVRVVLEHNLDAVDAGKLAGLTYIPKLFWVLLWLAGSVAAVAIGGSWLV
jgi:Peptidase M50B-like